MLEHRLVYWTCGRVRMFSPKFSTGPRVPLLRGPLTAARKGEGSDKARTCHLQVRRRSSFVGNLACCDTYNLGETDRESSHIVIRIV